MELDPFSNALFIFCGRDMKRIKAVFWDKSGFVMFYKILEEEKYQWPKHLGPENIEVDIKKLSNFLKGLNPWQIPHHELKYKKI